MSIEILDYIPQSSASACIGSFAVRFKNWNGFTVHEFRHCRKGNQEWVDLPQKFTKNEDGTWNKPTPKCFFPNHADNEALKKAIQSELAKQTQKPPEATQNDFPF
jgi:hypothetical protein